MRCAYGCHIWDMTRKPIRCKNCGEVIEPLQREHTSDLSYTKDDYDF